MPETIPKMAPPEGAPPERTPWVGMGLTVFLLAIWLIAIAGAPWLAPNVATFVNDLDLRYGFSAPVGESD